MDDFEKVISFESLYKGLLKSKRNVLWKDSVAGYSINALKNTYKLRAALKSGKYKLDPYQVFEITEPKRRTIMATRIKDRQFQHSLCDNILYPEITKGFIRDNFACQNGRGVDDALNRMDAHLHRYYRKHGPDGWVLQCDISKFFGSTPHEVAVEAIKKRVSDKQAAAHASAIIRSFGKNGVGIGLGSQLSQITELAVLDDLDHYIKERLRIKHYLRYADDFVLIHPDQQTLQACLSDIRSKLAEIGLQLNSMTQIYPLKQGVKFLKWRFILTGSGKVIRKMNPKSISKERRKLKKLKAMLDAGKVSIDCLQQSMNAFCANARRGNTRAVQLAMDNYYKQIVGEECKYGKKLSHQPAGANKGRERADGRNER